MNHADVDLYSIYQLSERQMKKEAITTLFTVNHRVLKENVHQMHVKVKVRQHVHGIVGDVQRMKRCCHKLSISNGH